MNSFLTLLSIIIGFGFIIFLIEKKNKQNKHQEYHQLFELKSSLKYILISIFLSTIGIIRFNSLTIETYYFSPMIFIVLTIFFNLLVRKIYKRNIIIEVVGKTLTPRRNKKTKVLDKIFALIILLSSLLTPIILKKNKFSDINERKITTANSVFAKNGVDGFFRNSVNKIHKNAFHLSIFTNLEIWKSILL